ncbi:hypothetical protein BC941DRAFT_412887 [Chlamydoabsidia padenii]|nr:hypothetical protein BC941DRAFT_412887 [Chlamydoabsidia padenii]
MVNKTLLWSAIVASFASISTVLASDSDVLSLTEATFDDEVLKKDLILVEFFAPWCGHCKALAPEYEVAATQLKGDNIPLAKVDCTEQEALCQKHEVHGYPTLKVFRKGESADYNGARKADGIVSYMKKQNLPAVSELTAIDALDKFKTSDRVVVIAYIKPDDKETKETFDTLANKLRDEFSFGVVNDDKLAKDENVKEFPTLVLYKTFDEKRVDLSGAALKDEDWTGFVKANSIALLDQVDGDNYKTYADSGLPLGYVFTENDQDRAKFDALLRPVAEKYKGKINLVHINGVEYAGHASNVGLKKEDFPAFAVQNLENHAKYPFLPESGQLTTENAEQFVKGVLAGTIAPSLNSAQVPESNDGPVKVVVGKQFNDIVLDKSKDVFLEVYAPWCGHCKKLAPTWEKLGEQVKTAGGNLVIAKLDGIDNDIPPEAHMHVSGFPTLKFVKAETNEVVDYNGDRSYEDLVRFINEQVTDRSFKLELADDTPETEDKADKKVDETEEAKNEAADHDEL